TFPEVTLRSALPTTLLCDARTFLSPNKLSRRSSHRTDSAALDSTTNDKVQLFLWTFSFVSQISLRALLLGRHQLTTRHPRSTGCGCSSGMFPGFRRVVLQYTAGVAVA